jgi:biopolymer transport protein ExbD
MAKRKRTELPKPELNITSMMDLVLNLLMFFVLLANFAMAELPAMTPPKPLGSQARASTEPDKVTVNIIPEKDASGRVTGAAKGIKFGSAQELLPTETGKLTQLLIFERQKSLKAVKEKDRAAARGVTVDLRADEGLRYDQVQPIMAAIQAAGIRQINLVAAVKD